MILKIASYSPLQTQQLGKELGSILPAGSLIALVGELGSGKTYLAQGIIRGLGVATSYITSPSYTLINEYRGRYPVYHFDLYRLENTQQVEELGYEEYFSSHGVTIIEWADRIRELLPRYHLEIRLKGLAEDTREVTFIPKGVNYQELLNQLKRVRE
jgi:tRNA threonylcarbamoyladenosine biosynthesis protein TsaE